MKKINMFLLAAMGLGLFTSCEDAPVVPPMQKNEQGPVLETNLIKVQPAAILKADINLDDYVSNSEVTLFTVTEDALPEGMTFSAYVELCGNENFSDDVITLPLSVDGMDIKSDLADWHDAHIELIGDDGALATMYYRVYAMIQTENGAEYRLGSENNYIAEGSVKETPMVSLLNYDYWYTPGGANGWKASNSMYIYNVGKSDHPKLYAGCLFVDGGGFKIANTTDWSGIDYGMTTYGILSSPGSNIVPTDGDGLYWLKADFDEMTYSMAKINSVGIIGNGNWDNDIQLTPNDDMTVWTGEADLKYDWKIRFNGNWDFNLGGALGNPILDGDNFTKCPGPSIVTVTFKGHHPVIKVKAK